MSKKISKQEAIKRAKAWTEHNYNKGCDVFVESWSDDDWEKLWDDTGSFTAMMKHVNTVSSIWYERQQDAKNSAF